jgi:D-amino peptidase
LNDPALYSANLNKEAFMSNQAGVSRRDFFKTSGISGAVLAAGATNSAAENAPFPSSPEAAKSTKIFMITDMEGVDGIFDFDLQCTPYVSPRWAESQKLLTGEVNAAVEGLFEGGATQVVVWDGHDSSRSLSVLDIHPKARLLTGEPVSPTLQLDPSYSAVIFVGQHAMAGAKNGILNHSYSSQGIQNIWVNNMRVGEIGGRVLLAGSFGIPVIMLSGDTAACEELRALVPHAECAEVKSGIGGTAGFMLPHPEACALIQGTARRALKRLPEFKPYRITGPAEVKVEFTTRHVATFLPREGVEQLDQRTWAFRGKDIQDAWLKYSSF